MNLIGENGKAISIEEGNRLLATRPPNPMLHHDEFLPDDTRLWAALQAVSGGTWAGSVYDVDRILEVLAAGQRGLGE